MSDPLTMKKVFMFLNQAFTAVGVVVVVSSVTPFFVALLIPLGTIHNNEKRKHKIIN